MNEYEDIIDHIYDDCELMGLDIDTMIHEMGAAQLEVNFIHGDPLKLAEDTAQAFMGMRVQCAQCHNHPFDRWSMNDYYSFAAFFAQVGRKPGGGSSIVPESLKIIHRPEDIGARLIPGHWPFSDARASLAG